MYIILPLRFFFILLHNELFSLALVAIIELQMKVSIEISSGAIQRVIEIRLNFIFSVRRSGFLSRFCNDKLFRL